MSKNYNIIAFEGLDCSFKETNCKAFVNYAKYAVEVGTTIVTESFPRYENESSIFVRKWLDGKSFDRDFLKKHSMAVDSFYSIDRFSYWYDRTDHNGYSIMDIMKQNTNTFYTFIFDRYPETNEANGGWVTNPRKSIHGKTTTIWLKPARKWLDDHELEIDWNEKMPN